jgi:SAM-dependent methyltransferase
MYLLLGAGNDRRRKVCLDGRDAFPMPPITLDINPDCKPDVIHDLNKLPYPFEADTFAEIHAYEVLEHCGSQGDWRFFFGQFEELWRILKPGGTIHITVPMVSSVWAWGDPGHTRVLPVQVFGFLRQESYQNTATTPMTDYRHEYWADFDIVASLEEEGTTFIILRAVK